VRRSNRPRTRKPTNIGRRTSNQEPPSRTWLLLVHQLPAHPSNLRVQTWRRLQQIGAIPVKQAVYVLPDTPAAREDFEWLKGEIAAAGGGATIFTADCIDNWSDDRLVDAFRRSRQEAYDALARDVERALKHKGKKSARTPGRGQTVEAFRQKLTAIEQMDFFGGPGRDRVQALLGELAAPDRSAGARAATTAAASGRRGDYRRRTWATRPRPGVDRMASAWLIRRFIDPDARFTFAADRGSIPSGAIPFDMFGVAFSHKGDRCTFETLCATFDLESPALARIGAIVHDLDLKDSRFGAAEAAAVGALVEGLQRTHENDGELLDRGIATFEALYRGFDAPRGRPAAAAVRARNRRHK
jgi:hypothetical protein